MVVAVLAFTTCINGVQGQVPPEEIRARRAAAQAEKEAERRREHDAELTKAMPELDRLIASDKPADWRSALGALTAAARKFEKAGGPHPFIQARLGQLALRDNKPHKAIDFVAAFTESREEFHVDHVDCWLVLAQAHLRLAGFQPHYDNDAMSIDRLHLFSLPVDPEEVLPLLNEEQQQHVQRALVLTDWVAGETNGVGLNQARAAIVCAQALAMKADYHQAIDAYNFALHIIQRDRTSEGAADPHARERGEVYRQRDHVQRIWDIQRYAIEYVLFREADTLRRRGRYEDAITAYVKCIEAADNTMLRLLEAQLSADFGAVQKAEEAAARRRRGEIDEKPDPDESPYTAAAKFHIGLCLIGLERYPQAVRHFEAFIKSDPGNVEGKSLGLFRGEAMLELGKLALERELNFTAAEKYYLQLEDWIVEARAENEEWNFTALLPGITQAAKHLTDGPKSEKVTDFWGNIKRAPLSPGMIVERKTTPWYLDDLEEQCAKFRGFKALAKGDLQQAGEHFERLLALDEEIAKATASGIPSDYSRLMFAIEHGYLVAYPDELKHYDTRRRLIILLGDFYYVTERFSDAERLFSALLDGTYGTLSSAQRDYPLFAKANSVCWLRGRVAALPLYDAIIESNDRTLTEYRAALASSLIRIHQTDVDVQRQGLAMLQTLVNSRTDNEFVHAARITLARVYLANGLGDKARALLTEMPRSAGSYKTMAEYYLSNWPGLDHK